MQAQKDASDKSSYIANLKTCQGGVQQALNALSVGDENHAVSALNGVSAACRVRRPVAERRRRGCCAFSWLVATAAVAVAAW